jgi:hypothetical protein
MDVERWTTGGYERAVMAQVVAWHRLRGMVEAHIDDARSSYVERRAKRGR